MGIGAVIGGGLSLIGGLVGANAAQHAAGTQATAANYAARLQNQQYEQTRSDMAPYRTAGYAGLTKLSDLLGTGPPSGSADYGSLLKDFTGADLTSEPGYQFRLGEGTKALERSAAAKGGLYSGATLKGLTRYGQDYASGEYSNAFNRDLTSKQAKYNFLAGITGTGQTATAQTANLGAENSAQLSNLITSGGAARAAGTVGSSNALLQGLTGAGNAAQNYYLLNRLFPQTQVPPTTSSTPFGP